MSVTGLGIHLKNIYHLTSPKTLRRKKGDTNNS
jgi:hypothetical protein